MSVHIETTALEYAYTFFDPGSVGILVRTHIETRRFDAKKIDTTPGWLLWGFGYTELQAFSKTQNSETCQWLHMRTDQGLLVKNPSPGYNVPIKEHTN